jgi:hypothetical protein
MEFKMDLDFFSDLYKDVHGIRPRGIQPTAEHVEYLQRELEYQLAEEQAVQQKAVDMCLSVGASSTDVALRWLEQAERY